uniref:Alpha-hydroxy-acid oxidizing protein n=1 Tax=Acidicaldus sp. TaxID=1872105 RepID=A0A8J4HBU1_9PROT
MGRASLMSEEVDLTERYQALHEFIPAAEQALPREIWGYLMGGAETETTVARNRAALDALAFRPRVLRDVSRIDTSASFLGQRIRLPVALAPVGSLESFHPGAGAEVARAAGAFGVPFLLSSVSRPTLEEAAQAATGPRVFQLYVRGDAAWVDEHARRAIAAGYDAFCLTVDTAHYSRRERDIVNRFIKPWRLTAQGMEFQAALNWDDVRRFKERHAIPLMLKGIATAEDAAEAAAIGVEFIYVSNHGGRQLDHGRGAMEMLPEVVAAVRGRAKIVIDGGFSRGTDIVKAIALGADLVGLGRLFLYGLAVAGAAGVGRVLELLEEEVGIALALLGAPRLADLNPNFIAPALPLTPAHVHSAFPLRDLPVRR